MIIIIIVATTTSIIIIIIVTSFILTIIFSNCISNCPKNRGKGLPPPPVDL